MNIYHDTLNDRKLPAKNREQAWLKLRELAYLDKLPIPTMRDIVVVKMLEP